MKVVHVAAGIIVKNKQVFISKRAAEQHQGNKWEFPGGKVESNETAEAALYRELKEEVDLNVESAALFHSIHFDYGDKKVLLDFFLVTEFAGIAKGLEGQETAWVNISDLSLYQFPAANLQIVKMLMADDAVS